MNGRIGLRVFAMVLALGVAGSVEATVVELALPCEGRYDLQTPGCTVDFDLGVEFSEISHVYIDWSGQIMGGLATYSVSPPAGSLFPVDFSIAAFFEPNPYSRATSIIGGESTYPNPERFDQESEFLLWGGSTWSDLMDGTASVSLLLSAHSLIEVQIVEHGYVDLENVSIVVEGVVVPEPATVVLLGLGFIVVRRACGERAGLC